MRRQERCSVPSRAETQRSPAVRSSWTASSPSLGIDLRSVGAAGRAASVVWIGFGYPPTRRSSPASPALWPRRGPWHSQRSIPSDGHRAAPQERAAATSPATLRALPTRALHPACARAHRRDRHRVARPWAPKRGLRHRPLPHPLGRNHRRQPNTGNRDLAAPPADASATAAIAASTRRSVPGCRRDEDASRPRRRIEHRHAADMPPPWVSKARNCASLRC